MADSRREEFKRAAAYRAVEYVESGMVVGLGGGSTALWAIRRIGALLGEGKLTDIRGIPCSAGSEIQARQSGIPLTTLDNHQTIDLTIDGADEISPDLGLIKGGGGALLREKIVAQASRWEIIVADDSKLSPALGLRSPLPVEVLPFGWKTQLLFLESLGAQVVIRRCRDGDRYLTEQGNFILDCDFGKIAEPNWLALALGNRAGIVGHGLFLHLTGIVIVTGEEGTRIVETGGLQRERAA